MISHSPHTILNRTERIGSFSAPGVEGNFEVRYMKNRKERPLFMVLHSDWENTPVYEKVNPVVELTIEKNGKLNQISQVSFLQDLKNLEVNFSQRVLDFLTKNGFTFDVTEFNRSTREKEFKNDKK